MLCGRAEAGHGSLRRAGAEQGQSSLAALPGLLLRVGLHFTGLHFKGLRLQGVANSRGCEFKGLHLHCRGWLASYRGAHLAQPVYRRSTRSTRCLAPMLVPLLLAVTVALPSSWSRRAVALVFTVPIWLFQSPYRCFLFPEM